MELDWNHPELAEGLRCYCLHQFFAAHEHWEIVWLKLEEPEKTFLQALIQISAAFHHLQRGNKRGTLSLLLAAQNRLTNYADHFAGVPVACLRTEILEWISALDATDASGENLPYPYLK